VHGKELEEEKDELKESIREMKKKKISPISQKM